MENEFEATPQENESFDTQTEVETVSASEPIEDTDWKSEALKYKAILDRKSKDKPSINPVSPNIEERLERQDLRIEGYSNEEVDFILKNGGRPALSNEFVKGAIETMRNKRKSVEATPESGGKSPVFRKYTERDLRNMPLDKLEEILQ